MYLQPIDVRVCVQSCLLQRRKSAALFVRLYRSQYEFVLNILILPASECSSFLCESSFSFSLPSDPKHCSCSLQTFAHTFRYIELNPVGHHAHSRDRYSPMCSSPRSSHSQMHGCTHFSSKIVVSQSFQFVNAEVGVS